MQKFTCATGVSVALFSTLSFASPAELPSQTVQEKFEQALSLRESGDLYAAIDQLENILTTQPKLHRARLELAVAYYRAAEYDKASALAKSVIEDPETEDNVEQVVSIFLGQIEELQQAEDQQRNQWSSSITLGIGSDDNVNVGPSDEEFNIRGSILRLSADSKPTSDTFANIGVGVNHTYRIPGTLSLGNKPVSALWQSSLNVTRRDYKDEEDRSLDVISGSTGFTLVSRNQWRAGLNLQLDQLRIGNESLVLFSNLNPYFTYNDQLGSEYTLRGQIGYRGYNKQVDKNRDGKKLAVGGDYVHRFDNAVLLQTGITFADQDAKIENQKNKSVDGYISALVPTWQNGQFFSRASYRVTDYDGQVAVFNEARKDKEQRYTVGVSHSFTGDWQLRASATHTDNQSSVGSFEFDRNEFSIDLTKLF